MHNERGMTLMELIIVLAIITIIGAILVPTYMNTTEKARLKSDIQSAKVLQNAIELYNAEHATPLSGEMSVMISTLGEKGYIDAQQAIIQTTGAAWKQDSTGRVVVDLSQYGTEASRQKLYSQLSEQEKIFVTGVTP